MTLPFTIQTLPPVGIAHVLELVVYLGQSSRSYALASSGQLSVGRGMACDIRIDDLAISRHHLTLHVSHSLMGSSVELEDLGSANGTVLVRGEYDGPQGENTHTSRSVRVEPHVRVTLNEEDTLRIGSAILVLERREPLVAHTTLRPDMAAAPKLADGWMPAVLAAPVMKRVYDVAALASATDISILILGETGVGKEVLAEFIHRRSTRANGPFLRLNCAALSESLLESELFGHEKGAFTGALQAKSGLLESTDGGTVFLDEVGELPASLQVKLLRVLEERVVRRVGSTRARPIDVRFVTATNRDLRREVSKGHFRGDLYFRINGVSFNIPPLRERKEEIEPLAMHFLTQACVKANRPVPQMTAEARARLQEYSWWGNVREVRNVMERASFLCEEGPLLAEHLPEDAAPIDEGFGAESTDVYCGGISMGSSFGNALSNGPPVSQSNPALNTIALSERSPLAPPGVPSTERSTSSAGGPGSPRIQLGDEQERILAALNECGGNQTRAAQLLGISRRTLINRLDEMSLPRPRKGR